MKILILIVSFLLPFNLNSQLIDTNPDLNNLLILLLENNILEERINSDQEIAREICISRGYDQNGWGDEIVDPKSRQKIHLALTCIVLDKSPAIVDPWKPPSLIPESVTPKEWDMALLFYKNGYDENDPRYLETVNSVEYSQDVLTSESWLNIFETRLEVTPIVTPNSD